MVLQLEAQFAAAYPELHDRQRPPIRALSPQNIVWGVNARVIHGAAETLLNTTLNTLDPPCPTLLISEINALTTFDLLRRL